MSLSSCQPCWTQSRPSFNTCLPEPLVSYVSEWSSSSMSISEALGEAIDLLHVLKGSSALIYSWTCPLDADYMAVFMLGLGHSGLSPRLISLSSHRWLFNHWPLIPWQCTVFIGVGSMSLCSGTYTWQPSLISGFQFPLFFVIVSENIFGGKRSTWTCIRSQSCWRMVHLGWMSFWFPLQLFSEHYFPMKLQSFFLYHLIKGANFMTSNTHIRR